LVSLEASPGPLGNELSRGFRRANGALDPDRSVTKRLC
jgi:hypothetical protein